MKCDKCLCLILSYNFFKVYAQTLCMTCFDAKEYIKECECIPKCVIGCDLKVD